jgi:acyl carrier protein phosphodiesterase
MNFLAHLFLSCEREPLMVGNFLADFVRNRDVLQLPSPIIEGIQLHRRIDTYTDNHPIVRQGVRRLYPYHSKYAPVIIDVYYDYFLSKNWALYQDEPITVFTNQVYEVLLKHIDIMPAFLQGRLERMVDDNWLMTYSHYEGIQNTFRRMKNRVSKPALLRDAVLTMQEQEKALDAEFKTFFPDVMNYVRKECLC